MTDEFLKKSVALLAMREHSKAELKRKLALKCNSKGEQAGKQHDVLDRLLDRLEAAGLQSDDRFVEAYVNSRVRQGYGPFRIAYELRNKGVTESLIQAALPKDLEFWRLSLQALIQKKYHGKPPESRQEQARYFRFLQGRGFAPGMIMQQLDEL